MKKLLIAASLIAATTLSQAATVDWSSNTTKLVDATGTVQTSVTGGSIVLVLLSNSTGWTEGTWSAAKGTVTELASATIGTGKSKGKISGATYTFTYDDTNVSASPLKNGDVLAVVFRDSAGAYDQLEYYTSKSAVTETLTVSGLDSTAWTGELLFGQGTASAGGIYAPVPEPTSAMLLVLGLCGLALKRKNV